MRCRLAREIVSGVYCITNTTNGHRYIGSSVNIHTRWSEHKSDLRKGVHDNAHLQNAWNKYGEAAFEFTILLTCGKDDTLLHEQNYLDSEKPEYNIATCAVASARGLKRSAETRQKMSEAMTGKHLSEERKRHLSELNKGNTLSAEARAKVSAFNKGKVVSEETRRKLSEAGMGHIITEETRAKLCAGQQRRHNGTQSG